MQRISKEAVLELLCAYNESADDYNRVHTTYYVGTQDEIIDSLSCERGNVKRFREQYESLREICLTSTLPRWEQSDIGPIRDKFFFFSDDSLKLYPPLLRNKAQPSDVFNNAIGDEWNALQHIQTHGQERLRKGLQEPFYLEVLELWRKRSIPYSKAVAKVAAMVIAPKPPGQRHSWRDLYGG